MESLTIETNTKKRKRIRSHKCPFCNRRVNNTAIINKKTKHKCDKLKSDTTTMLERVVYIGE